MKSGDTFIEGLRALFAAHPELKPATISAAAGMNKSAIRKMLEGQVASPRFASIIAIADAIGLSAEDIIAQRFDGLETAEQAPKPPMELSEQVTAYVPQTIASETTLDAVLAPQVRSRAMVRVNVGAPGFGILAGDLLVIDMRSEPRAGDIVLGAVMDGDFRETRILRYLPPVLISDIPTEPPIPEATVRIQGGIVAVARGPIP